MRLWAIKVVERMRPRPQILALCARSVKVNDALYLNDWDRLALKKHPVLERDGDREREREAQVSEKSRSEGRRVLISNTYTRAGASDNRLFIITAC